MARTPNRNPSGLATNRIMRPFWGKGEVDVDDLVARQPHSALRARNTLLTVTLILAVAIAAIGIWGNSTVAANLAILFLAPLAMILGITQAALMFTRR